MGGFLTDVAVGDERPRFARLSSEFPTVAMAGIIVVITAAMAAVKLHSFAAWQYTSDLFTWDQMLGQTLQGRFGLEFTYGNQFGDHAYLLFLALLPIKAIAGSHMPAILVCLGPAVCALALLTFLLAVRVRTTALFAAAAACALLLHAGFGEGLMEVLYGCHPDVAGGFAAVAMAAVWSAIPARSNGGLPKSRLLQVLFLVWLAIFLAAKEEMALLAACFFASLAVLPPDQSDATRQQRSVWRRKNAFLALISAAVFAGDMLLIRWCQTPWNRTNAALVTSLGQRARSGDLAALFSTPAERRWLIFVLVAAALFGAAWLISTRLNAVAAALASIAFIKFAFSLAVPSPFVISEWDFDLTSWHNYPAVVMITAAVLLQLAGVDSLTRLSRRAAGFALLYAILIVEITAATAVEYPWLRHVWFSDSARRREADVWAREIDTMRPHIPLQRVLSVDLDLATAFPDPYRVAFFPHGVSLSPIGIADFIVVPRAASAHANVSEFEVAARTAHLVLLRRSSITPAARAWRDRFIAVFGADAVQPWK